MSINSDENNVIFINKHGNQLIFNEWTTKKNGTLRLRLLKYDGELDDERLNFWIITSSVWGEIALLACLTLLLIF